MSKPRRGVRNKALPQEPETFFKKLGYRWKRFRASLKQRQDPVEYKTRLHRLKLLIKLWEYQYIDLYYADESGFALKPTIPYGWQPTGQTCSVLSKDSKRLNVLGFLSFDQHLRTFHTTDYIDAAFVIKAIDEMVKTLRKPTVIIVDNAPMHRAKLFYDQIPEWQNQDLYIFFLPRYSPHLNKIEMLWRKIKYEWLKPQDYGSFKKLKAKLNHIFEQFGDQYKIQFKELENT